MNEPGWFNNFDNNGVGHFPKKISNDRMLRCIKRNEFGRNAYHNSEWKNTFTHPIDNNSNISNTQVKTQQRSLSKESRLLVLSLPYPKNGVLLVSNDESVDLTILQTPKTRVSPLGGPYSITNSNSTVVADTKQEAQTEAKVSVLLCFFFVFSCGVQGSVC